MTKSNTVLTSDSRNELKLNNLDNLVSLNFRSAYDSFENLLFLALFSYCVIHRNILGHCTNMEARRMHLTEIMRVVTLKRANTPTDPKSLIEPLKGLGDQTRMCESWLHKLIQTICLLGDEMGLRNATGQIKITLEDVEAAFSVAGLAVTVIRSKTKKAVEIESNLETESETESESDEVVEIESESNQFYTKQSEINFETIKKIILCSIFFQFIFEINEKSKLNNSVHTRLNKIFDAVTDKSIVDTEALLKKINIIIDKAAFLESDPFSKRLKSIFKKRDKLKNNLDPLFESLSIEGLINIINQMMECHSLIQTKSSTSFLTRLSLHKNTTAADHSKAKHDKNKNASLPAGFPAEFDPAWLCMFSPEEKANFSPEELDLIRETFKKANTEKELLSSKRKKAEEALELAAAELEKAKILEGAAVIPSKAAAEAFRAAHKNPKKNIRGPS